MTADHVLSLRDALLDIVRDGADLTDVLSGALGRAAVELGSVAALVGDRDGREADALRTLAGWAHPADVLPLPREETTRPGLVLPRETSEYVYLRRRMDGGAE